MSQCRFCLSNVLSFGTTFFDLVLQCTQIIETGIQVSYEPTSPADLAFSKAMLKIAFSGRRKQDLDDDASMNKQTKLFLQIFNGNWKSRSIVHHCSFQCPCKGTRDLGKLAGELFAAVALGARPVVPALSRWLKCASTAKWYLLLNVTG